MFELSPSFSLLLEEFSCRLAVCPVPAYAGQVFTHPWLLLHLLNGVLDGQDF